VGLLQQAILALQAGHTAEARRLLATLLQQNPNDATAWVWLGTAMDDPAKRRECFARALHLDPDNEDARRGMVALLSGPSAAGEEAQPTAEAPTREAPAEDGGEPASLPKEICAYPSPCPSCGAHLEYDIGARALRCQHCGTEKPIAARTSIVEWLGMPPDLSGADAQAELIRRETLRCRSCGATTELSSRTASLNCPYCGSPQVARSKGQSYLIPPRALIPFEVDEEGAKHALQEWLAAGYWHPDDLAERAEIVELHGAYLPFWGFKGLAEVTFQLEGGMAVESMPALPSRQTQHIGVQDLLIPGSLGLNERAQRQIGPFDLDQAVPFQPEYLAGWPAEVYQVALADATIEARGRMSREARNKADGLVSVLNTNVLDDYDIGGLISLAGTRRGRAHNRQVSYRPTVSTIRLDSFMHYVLPVWVGAYRYRGRTYTFAVNGQTGKAGGEAPRGGTNTVLTVVLGAAILALVGFLLYWFWPAIARFLGGLFSSNPADGTPVPQSTLYLGAGIMIVVVFVLFGLAANWKKMRAWFGGREDEKHRR
jgi:DNA-directed RNA polymerase subunit RPC12/RpoP